MNLLIYELSYNIISTIYYYNMNPKNQLLEYCQKNKIEYPKYETNKISEQHFQSKVSITLLTGEYLCIIGTKANDKKTTEKDASERLLKKINNTIWNKKKIYNKKHIGIFVDYENKPIFHEQLNEFYDLDKSFIFTNLFISKFHHMINKIKDYNMPKGNIFVCESSYKDSADTFMIYMVSKLEDEYDIIILISNDHFIYSLKDILSSNNKKVFIINNIEDIINILE